MTTNSKIEWTDHTFNPWEGCQKIGPGCDHCYAETRNARFGGGVAVNWGPGAPRWRTSASNWRKPIRWNANACWFVQCNDCGWRGESKGAVCGRCSGTDTSEARQRVFCASLADVFDNAVDPQWRVDLFDLIRQTPNLDWLLLTKRIGNVRPLIIEAISSPNGLNMELATWLGDWLDGEPPPANVWLGATVVNQTEADRDIPKLLEMPARVRFLSVEPMLGAVDLTSVEWPNKVAHRVDVLRGGYWNKAGILACGPSALLGEKRGGFTNHSDMPSTIDWVIVGGESGPGARPMHPDWARSLRDQCNTAGVPFFFKQWGEHLGAMQDGNPDAVEQVINATDGPLRVGKKAAGRLLDGSTWDEAPA